MKDVKVKTLTLRPTGEIDHHAARRIRDEADARILTERPSVIVIDFSAVSFMDTSGIGLILGRKNLADEIGATVALRGLNERLMRIIKMSGVLRLPGISLDKEE